MKRGREGMRKSSQNEQVAVFKIRTEMRETSNIWVASLQNVFIGTRDGSVSAVHISGLNHCTRVLARRQKCRCEFLRTLRRNPFHANKASSSSRGAPLRVRRRRPPSSSPGSPRPGWTSMCPFITSGWGWGWGGYLNWSLVMCNLSF